MEGNVLLLLPVLFPIFMGILVLTGKRFRTNRNALIVASLTGLAGGSLDNVTLPRDWICTSLVTSLKAKT